MCCITVVNYDPGLPIDLVRAELKRIAELAGFESITDTHYTRNLPPGESDQPRSVSMTLMEGGNNISLRLQPSIAAHTLHDHSVNALGGSILFKVAMTLGERLGAEVRQHSLVGTCSVDGGASSILLAQYPSQPLLYEKLCYGFREVLLHGVGQEPPQEV